MSARLGAILVCVLTLAAGCAGNGGDLESAARETARLSPADFAWLERYGNWSTRYNQAANKAGEVNVALLGNASSVAELERRLRPTRDCTASFRKSVTRQAPTRFEPVEPLVERACDQLRLAADRLVKSYSDPATHAYKADEHFSKASTLLLDVDAAIQRRMAANRPLPSTARSGQSRSDPRLGRIASRFASRPIDVRCWAPSEWPDILRESKAYGNRNIDFVGMADPLRDVIHLAPKICRDLSLLLAPTPPSEWLADADDIAEAVETLAHEIEHILAPGTERRVECAAIQRTAQVAQALGLRRPIAVMLASVYWRKVYPEMPDNYRSPHCKSGGAFDVHPDSARWPTA